MLCNPDTTVGLAGKIDVKSTVFAAHKTAESAAVFMARLTTAAL